MRLIRRQGRPIICIGASESLERFLREVVSSATATPLSLVLVSFLVSPLFPLFALSLSFSLRFFLSFVSVLSIIDSRACFAPSTSFSRCNGAEATRTRRTAISVSSTLRVPARASLSLFPSPMSRYFLSVLSRKEPQTPFCALHLLITNDKFAVQLRRRDRTDANSRCRKCANPVRTRCASPPSRLAYYSSDRTTKINPRVSPANRKFNLLIRTIVSARELKR